MDQDTEFPWAYFWYYRFVRNSQYAAVLEKQTENQF